jgi:hypothetical protein
MKPKYENQVILYKRSIPGWDDCDYSANEELVPAAASVKTTIALVATAPIRGAFLVLNFLADVISNKEA